MSRLRFSANLGFLWADLPLPEAIRAAARAGFDAVECHWPYDRPVAPVQAALRETGLPMLGLNTTRGSPAAGEMGLAALPGRAAEAETALALALDHAVALGARHVHVMAGRAEGSAAHAAFVAALKAGCDRAAAQGLMLVIEPMNAFDAPGYFLRTTAQAQEIIAEVGRPNLRLMFDCYHVARTEGAVTDRLRALRPLLGHVQVAGVPDRGPPDRGTLDYAEVWACLRALGWGLPVGAEYRPDGAPEDSLGWLAAARAAR